jgi:hypothetical protein
MSNICSFDVFVRVLGRRHNSTLSRMSENHPFMRAVLWEINDR